MLAEVARRADERKKVDFAALCFPEQRAFVEDDRPLVAALCGRRGGKSDGIVLKALRVASRIDGCAVPLITNSRPQAKRNLWPKLQLWNRVLNLKAKFNHAELVMTLPNGSRVFLGGANDEAEIERYRGGAYPLVILDEAQSLRSFLRYFIEDVLLPTLADYDGQLVMIGTPGARCSGYFHDATNPEAEHPLVDPDTGGPLWSTHRWTSFENPNINRAYREGAHRDIERALRDVRETIRRLCAAANIDPTSARYRREWLAQWVQSHEGLVYRVHAHNIEHELPQQPDWRYILGMDVGYVDATAFVVIAHSRRMGCAYVLESWQKTEMLPSQIVAEVNRANERWPFESIVIDPGGGGRALTAELAERHGIPARSAEKRDKIGAIETLNSDLASGTIRFLARGNEQLLEDLDSIKWDVARLQRRGGDLFESLKPINHLAIDQSYPDHLADALLYGYREASHWLGHREKDGPTPGSLEALLAEEEAMFQAHAKKHQAAAEGPWWAGPGRP